MVFPPNIAEMPTLPNQPPACNVGIWFYVLGTALTGILDIAWGDFDASHQPIKSLGVSLLSQHIMA